MSVNPAVSVIIPVFNLEKYLRDAIESVRAQTFHDLEMILVDDGSTDRSREIIAGYQRREPDRVRAVFMRHAGAAAARNSGIDLARGQWIAFLDGDDMWRPRKLERQLEEAHNDPGINLLSTWAEIIGKNRRIPEASPESEDLRLELLLKGCLIVLSSVLMRSELLSSTRFDPRLPGAQDLDLFLRLADRACHRVIPESLVMYRMRAGAISDPKTSHYAQILAHYRVMRREEGRLKEREPAQYQINVKKLRAVRAGLAREAAYHATVSLTASWPERVQACWIAVREAPARIKHYRFLLQALLPGRVNRWMQARLDSRRKADPFSPHRG